MMRKKNILGNVYCMYNNLAVPTGNCADGTARAKCVQINMAGDYASRESNNLQCTFALNVSTDADKIVGFEIVNDKEFGLAYTWIRANLNAWVVLTKSIIQPKGQNEFIVWGRQLLYHSSVFTTDNWTIDIKMDHFHVAHYEENDYYTGWMAFGDIGGVAFFLVILHTIVMAVVGLCMDNNSKFLHAGEGGREFQPISKL